MIRESLGKHYIGMNKEFRFRGEEPGRLENVSDGVFALAITLLLISTNAPVNFDEIRKFVWELLPFCVCIVLIILIWHEHFVFFYRYGFRNTKIVVLNTLFLIIVLFYVYPLKFLFKFLSFLVMGRIFNEESLSTEISQMFRGDDTAADLMIIYGTGAASIFIVLMLMYRYALKQSHLLQLNEIEKFDTRTSMISNLLMATVPCLSVILAVVLRNNPSVGIITGFTYFLYTPMMLIFHFRTSKKRKKLLDENVLT